MADQEFLASFAVDIDEAGVSRLQKVLEDNRELADILAASFAAASESLHSFAEELGLLPDFSGRGIVTEGLFGSGGLSIGLNLTQAFTDYESFTALVKQPISLKASAAGIVSAARTAMSSIQSIFSSPVTIHVKAEQDGGEEGTGGDAPVRMSVGGRFSRPTDVQVAEDGDTEYIIPVKKEERAIPLLRQLLGELSPDARERLNGEAGHAGEVPEIRLISENKSASAAVQPLPAVREAFAEPALMQTMMATSDEKNKFPNEGISGIFAKLENLLSVSLHDVQPSVVQNTGQNVSAPVTIQVRSTGASTEQVGQKLYDTAERYLLRMLKGALA